MEFDPTGIFAVGAAGAVLFAAAARTAGQLWRAWVVWGLLIGLTVGSITVGLTHSIALPYSGAQVQKLYVIGAVLALALMAPVAWAIVFRARGR
jgi:hypothetical protein